MAFKSQDHDVYQDHVGLWQRLEGTKFQLLALLCTLLGNALPMKQGAKYFNRPLHYDSAGQI